MTTSLLFGAGSGSGVSDRLDTLGGLERLLGAGLGRLSGAGLGRLSGGGLGRLSGAWNLLEDCLSFLSKT